MAALSRAQFLNQKPDYSEFLVHLTRRRDDAAAWQVLAEILEASEVRGLGPHCLFNENISELPSGEKSRFNVACFSECPLETIGNLVQEVSGRQVQLEPYGVFVAKELVKEERGNPVLYVNWPASDKFFDLWELLVAQKNWWILNDIMPFVSIVKDGHDFHWEREWRIPGGLKIAPDSVPLVVCPETHIGLVQNRLRNTGHGDWLRVPFVDADWRPERIVQELSTKLRQP